MKLGQQLAHVGFAWGDTSRLSFVQVGRTQRQVPTWAYNPSALRRIFEERAQLVLRYGAGGRGYTREQLLKLYAGVVWRCYRLRLSSVDCASEMNISAIAVRQILHRLSLTARAIVPELCTPSRHYGGGLSRREYLATKIAQTQRALSRATVGRRANPTRAERLTKELAALHEEKCKRELEVRAAVVYSRAA